MITKLPAYASPKKAKVSEIAGNLIVKWYVSSFTSEKLVEKR